MKGCAFATCKGLVTSRCSNVYAGITSNAKANYTKGLPLLQSENTLCRTVMYRCCC